MSDAPGVGTICKLYKEIPVDEFIPEDKKQYITEKYWVIYSNKGRYGKIKAVVTKEELEVIEKENSYFYVRGKVKVSSNEYVLSNEEIKNIQLSIRDKDCSKITNADVIRVYKNQSSRIMNLQEVVDKFVAKLKDKMKETNNICGDGSDLDIIKTPCMATNALTNSTNLIITSDHSIAYGSSLSNLFEEDLQNQYKAS